MLTVLTARGLCAWACVCVTIISCTPALQDPLLPSLFVPVMDPWRRCSQEESENRECRPQLDGCLPHLRDASWFVAPAGAV